MKKSGVQQSGRKGQANILMISRQMQTDEDVFFSYSMLHEEKCENQEEIWQHKK
jgi:hypothetical protein